MWATDGRWPRGLARMMMHDGLKRGDGHPPPNRARVTVGAFCIGDRAFSASAPFRRVLVGGLGIPWQSRLRQGTTRSVRNVEATRTWW